MASVVWIKEWSGESTDLMTKFSVWASLENEDERVWAVVTNIKYLF